MILNVHKIPNFEKFKDFIQFDEKEKVFVIVNLFLIISLEKYYRI